MNQKNQLDLGFFTESQRSATSLDSDGQSSKTCQESYHLSKDSTLLQWLASYVGEKSLFLETAGKMPELHLAQKGSLSGEYWTRNIAEHRSFPEPSPSEGGVSSLSEILETGEVASRYFLTPKACAGILRRAEKRGRKLPPMLESALKEVYTRDIPKKTQATPD